MRFLRRGPGSPRSSRLPYSRSLKCRGSPARGRENAAELPGAHPPGASLHYKSNPLLSATPRAVFKGHQEDGDTVPAKAGGG